MSDLHRLHAMRTARHARAHMQVYVCAYNYVFKFVAGWDGLILTTCVLFLASSRSQH